ncbi:unnamed protein product [Paramecium pentaurelia]|uniref:Uncharacterized protein n=1 Tax=Paramecium pentaurelia TaxID=43138 RepID=A0A8S1VBE2_9CILI|nr:unnamed protein product [Paramecium pentaurelia]
MEELRKSIIKQEEEKMNNKLTLLEQSVGYPLNEYMNQEFINKIPEDSFLCYERRKTIKTRYQRTQII